MEALVALCVWLVSKYGAGIDGEAVYQKSNLFVKVERKRGRERGKGREGRRLGCIYID